MTKVSETINRQITARRMDTRGNMSEAKALVASVGGRKWCSWPSLLEEAQGTPVFMQVLALFEEATKAEAAYRAMIAIMTDEEPEPDTAEEATASDDGVAALVDACTRAWNKYYSLPDYCTDTTVSFHRAEEKAFAMVYALETVTGKPWSYEQNDRRMFVCA